MKSNWKLFGGLALGIMGFIVVESNINLSILFCGCGAVLLIWYFAKQKG